MILYGYWGLLETYCNICGCAFADAEIWSERLEQTAHRALLTLGDIYRASMRQTVPLLKWLQITAETQITPVLCSDMLEKRGFSRRTANRIASNLNQARLLVLKSLLMNRLLPTKLLPTIFKEWQNLVPATSKSSLLQVFFNISSLILNYPDNNDKFTIKF